ncbi:restriction endonuclease subunit S [Shewanella oncorhynchi]|uniref:restriction endonuclease subunit S n=1 Tax=Shewanella oncorhynchi TaxID=2726434 RepID=UPI003D7985DB
MSQTINQVIPEGYKQTEVGVIPEDWDVKQVKDVCGFIVPGRNKPRSFFGNIPWVTTSDIDHLNRIDTSKIYLHVSREEAAFIGSKIVPKNAVIMSCVGELGVVALVHEDIVINQQLHAFIPTTTIDGRYLSYVLASLKEYFYSKATKTTLPYLNKDNCNSTLISIPILKEQTAIANALSDIDALLSELKKLIAKKQAMKTATMQQLLTGKTRLPQFAYYSDINSTEGAVEGMRKHSSATNVNAGACDDGSLASQESVGMDSRRKGTKPSELGEIPEDWDVISIANLTRNIIDYRGRTPKKLGLDWGGGDIVALSAGNVKKGYIDFEEGCYLGSEELYKKWMKNGAVEKDDIVFTMEAPLGNVALIPDTNRYILSQRTILIQLDRELFDPSFVYQLMMSVQFQSLLSDSATGSTAQGIKRARFEQLLLCLPKNIKEQTAIASILSDMDSEIQTLEQRLSKTRQIKQGMMQELLTGRTRLPFEQAIEA